LPKIFDPDEIEIRDMLKTLRRQRGVALVGPGDSVLQLLFFVCLALPVGAAVGYFGPAFVFAAQKTEWALPAPDPQLIRPAEPGASFACDPLADAEVVDNRFNHKATVWTTKQASPVALEISTDGKRLSLMRAMDASHGITQPEEFEITSNTTSYNLAEDGQLTLGVGLIIFDVHTMKAVWSFNGQGMLGMKGETVLFQCR
jgi:hypothetical protein